MNGIRQSTILLLPLLLLGACADSQPPATVSIMTFNVENLFDTIDDPDKNDQEYQPLAAKQTDEHRTFCAALRFESWRKNCLETDWSDEVVTHKLETIATTIKQVGDGRGPDVIALQEIENLPILERLRSEYLADSGYLPAILIEGNDARGIDVAFLSRLPLASEPVLHPLTFADYPERQGDTRGALQATFELPDGGLLTGFAVHFPAPYHPTEMRIAAYEHLNALRAQLPDSHYVFAAGDFNTTSIEDHEEHLLDRFARPYWTLAHDQCAGCPGTHYYARDDRWSFLDMILFSPARGGNATWQIRANSVQLANANPAQVEEPGIPLRYDAAERRGVSDHWPLVMSIESKAKQ